MLNGSEACRPNRPMGRASVELLRQMGARPSTAGKAAAWRRWRSQARRRQAIDVTRSARGQRPGRSRPSCWPGCTATGPDHRAPAWPGARITPNGRSPRWVCRSGCWGWLVSSERPQAAAATAGLRCAGRYVVGGLSAGGRAAGAAESAHHRRRGPPPDAHLPDSTWCSLDGRGPASRERAHRGW